MTKDTDISDSLKKSKKLSAWVADRLDGLKIPDLPNNRRIQLAMACHHLVIEHGQALLVESCMVHSIGSDQSSLTEPTDNKEKR